MTESSSLLPGPAIMEANISTTDPEIIQSNVEGPSTLVSAFLLQNNISLNSYETFENSNQTLNIFENNENFRILVKF